MRPAGVALGEIDMAGGRGSDEKPEGPLEVVGFTLLGVAVIGALLWISANHKIVAFWTPPIRGLSHMWSWLPVDFAQQTHAELQAQAARLLAKGREVSFFEYAGWVNSALRPVMALVTLGCFTWLLTALFAPRADVFRQFKDADLLLRRMSRIFTGTAPILHIRKDIAQHKDPLWARQLFPEELLLKGKVHGKPLVMRNADGELELNEDRVVEWLKGIDPRAEKAAQDAAAKQVGPDGKPRPTRVTRKSTTLGRLVVDLTLDRGRFHPDQQKAGFSFADRFSDTGKVMFALLCARAFGGADGAKDYATARDQLNNSCRGAAHGMANLTVAQWLFDKYRTNDLAYRLFATHHWEYTYLYELFAQAKRRGKCTHAEFLWLKPMNRILFYVLNTVGRWTPHTESAATFNQHAFERRCARLKRLPLRYASDRDGLEHVIYVKGALAGLRLEWERHLEAVDENDDEWWKEEGTWKLAPDVAIRLTAPPIPTGEAADQLAATTFDATQARARAEASSQAQRREADALAALLGPDAA